MNYLLVMPKNAAKSSGGYNVFPVGIAYVAASLRGNDINVFTSNLEFVEGDTFHSLTDLMLRHKIDAICTSGLSRDYNKIAEIIACARRINPGVLTIVGGGIISGDPESAMAALDADIGVVGEGEITMVELAQALDRNMSYANIPGLIYRTSVNGYINTGGRAEIPDIDAIPMPDYDGFAFSQYMKSINYAVAYVIASRSCPYSCTFCFHPSGKKYRQRSLDNLFVEIDYLVKTYKINNLVISDELFAFKRERVLQFCKRISAYSITWTVQLRVCDVDKEILRTMRNSGCICVSYGVESADNAILKSMKKHITVEQIEVALQDTYDANIDIQGGFIFGDVAESMETARRTLKWHAEHVIYGLELNMINIFPGTGLYKYACEHGIIKDKIAFLKDGCPLTNVSTLRDDEYKALASLVYETNMRAKYLPDKYSLGDIDKNGKFPAEITCNKCGATFVCTMDGLHNKRIDCPKCLQRYYVDPFQKIVHHVDDMRRHFLDDGAVAIWGAGEICIKLLDKYPVFHEDKFIIVDRSGSRQGYAVCGKQILSPGVITTRVISALIVAVVDRKDEVLIDLDNGYPSVKRVYIPHVQSENHEIVFGLQAMAR